MGREQELSALEELVRSRTPSVLHVHGIAGIGKSALVAALAQRLQTAGIEVLILDCRAIEPTKRGLQAALEGVGLEPNDDGGKPLAIVLDHYEVFRLMDTWLRQELVPSLPASVHVLLVGREPAVAGWFSLASGFRSMPLGPLREDEALLLLEGLGLRHAEAARLNRVAHGHPLALTLAAAGVAEHPDLELEEAASGRVIDELARLYLEEVDDPLTRRALEAASVVRRSTEPLLGAMLEGEDPAQALERLLHLPFVDAGRDGVIVHEAVRDAIGGFLRSANPVRHRAYRRAAWYELQDEVRDAGPAELWRYTADMLYLIENPVVREAFFPSGAQPLAVEPARPDDAFAIERIAERHEPPEAALQLASWWTTSRPRSPSFATATASSRASSPSTEHIRRPRTFADPIVAGWAQHLRDNPVPKGQIVLGLRRWLDAERGELPCAAQAACWLDVKRAYMALRPALRRMYVVVHDVPTYWPVVEKLGFRPIAEDMTEIGVSATRASHSTSARAPSTAGLPDSWAPSSASTTSSRVTRARGSSPSAAGRSP